MKTYNPTTLAVLLVLTTFMLGGTPLPESQASDADTAGKSIRLAAPPEGWPPFVIINPDNVQHSTGIMVDVMREAGRNRGWQVTFNTFPEKRSRRMLEEGNIDAYPKAKEWVKKPGIYRWTDPVVISSDVLVFRADLFPPAGPPKLRDLSVGVVHGYVYPTLAPLFQSGVLKRYSATGTEQLLRMVQRGHIDVAVTNRFVAEWIIKNNDDLDSKFLRFTETPIDSAPYRFAFTKTWDTGPLVDQFNRELEKLKKSGRLEQIFNKYK